MILRLNRILDDSLIAQILATLFIDRPIKILKTISRTGRNASSVPWVYYENEISGNRFATFVSFDSLLQKFWVWLESVNLLALALFQRQAVSEVFFNYIKENDYVYSCQHGWGRVIEKERTESLSLPRFWIELESDSRIEKIEPCFVEIF